MSGKRVLPSVYRHTQQVAVAEWNIAHKLGGNGSKGVPIVDVIIEADGKNVKIIPMEVIVVDANNLTIVFSTALAGEAVIVV